MRFERLAHSPKVTRVAKRWGTLSYLFLLFLLLGMLGDAVGGHRVAVGFVGRPVISILAGFFIYLRTFRFSR